MNSLLGRSLPKVLEQTFCAHAGTSLIDAVQASKRLIPHSTLNIIPYLAKIHAQRRSIPQVLCSIGKSPGVCRNCQWLRQRPARREHVNRPRASRRTKCAVNDLDRSGRTVLRVSHLHRGQSASQHLRPAGTIGKPGPRRPDKQRLMESGLVFRPKRLMGRRHRRIRRLGQGIRIATRG